MTSSWFPSPLPSPLDALRYHGYPSVKYLLSFHVNYSGCRLSLLNVTQKVFMHGESKLYTVNLHTLSRSTIGLRTWAGIGHIRPNRQELGNSGVPAESCLSLFVFGCGFLDQWAHFRSTFLWGFLKSNVDLLQYFSEL